MIGHTFTCCVDIGPGVGEDGVHGQPRRARVAGLLPLPQEEQR
jgi:hypothetical protein